MSITQRLANLVFPAPRSNWNSSDAHLTDLPANQANKDRCHFTFSDGRRCRNQQAQFCLHHAAKQKRSAGAEDAPNAALEAPVLDAPELVALCADLTTAANINRALSQVFLLTAQGRISPKQAVAFGYLTQLLLQTVPGIRSEFISVHGYQAWQTHLRSKIVPLLPAPAPLPESPASPPQPASAPATTPVTHKEILGPPAPPSPDYTSIFHRSLDLLDRKYDTTPEGLREANALMLELELLNPKPAAVMKKEVQTPPVPSLPNVPATLKTALPELPSAPTQRATPEPASCSSGRPAEVSLSGEGGRPEAFSALPIAAASKPAGGFVAPPCPRKGDPRRVSTRPESEIPPPRRKQQAPTPTNRTAHSADWYAPASWSGPRPDPFPSRQKKQKRKLATMSDRRLQHQMQNRAFWH